MWFHVPKCGSTFLNAFTQHPGICPHATTHMVLTPDCDSCLKVFHRSYDIDSKCPNAFHFEKSVGFHQGVGTHYGLFKGHLMTIVREPTSRIISAYNFHKHSWPYNKRTVKGIKAYARVMQGQFLKMLVRNYGLGISEEERKNTIVSKVTQSEVREAHKRLNEGFAFVGVAEEWALSMCLFHAMFGSECVAAEFWKIHPAEEDKQQKRERLAQEKAMKSWRDPYDGPLYKAATKYFKADMKRFGVSDGTCGRCFRRAGLLQTYHNPVGGKYADPELYADLHHDPLPDDDADVDAADAIADLPNNAESEDDAEADEVIEAS